MQAQKYYHIYTHANGFENLFRSKENYRYFLERYKAYIPAVADTLAYCLMPNHVHFLVVVKSIKEIRNAFAQSSKVSSQQQTNLGGLSLVEKRISLQFSRLFNSYTKSFNKMYQRRGSLFIPNFKRKEVCTESYLTNLVCYIHRNPLHHGFTPAISDWRWSSYQEVLNDATSIINKQAILTWFGTKDAYLQAHEQATVPFADFL
jgi:putative transposase